MRIRCRVLPHAIAEGPENMAIDEALLESVARHQSEAVIRTYEWKTPTLTLGYFQPIRLPETEARWADVPILRRPTGGGAIWHDIEVTYSVVIPRSHPLARQSSDLYRAIHGGLIQLLQSRGVDARRRADVDANKAEGPRPLLCFLDSDPDDVVCRGHKLIGSAQRRRSGAVLQHGSILLGQSARTPELPGVAELVGMAQNKEAWSLLVSAAIPATLELAPEASELSLEETREAAALEQVVYRNRTWNERR